jgi:predicted ArsR family transcriptional regulator
MADNILINEFSNNEEMFTPLQLNLIKTLKSNGASTRRQLVKQLKTPRTTIYDNLVKLKKKELVKKFSRNNNKQGRPKVYWDLLEE